MEKKSNVLIYTNFAYIDCQAQDVLDELNVWRNGKEMKELQQVLGEKMGSTKVHLNGDFLTCNVRECNLGNLITDAFVAYVSIITNYLINSQHLINFGFRCLVKYSLSNNDK